VNEQLKKRLVGAAVLASLAVIFLPMILSEGRNLESTERVTAKIPPWPQPEFQSRLLKDEIISERPIPVPVEVEKDPGQEKPVITAPRVGLSAWVVQVASFSEIENARNLVDKLRKGGLDTPDSEQVEIRGSKVYRVIVGPEVEKENAEKLLPKIKELTGLTATVRRYP